MPSFFILDWSVVRFMPRRAAVRLGDDESAQLPGRHEKGLDFFLGIPVHQCVAAGELSDLTAKLSGPQAHDGNHMAAP